MASLPLFADGSVSMPHALKRVSETVPLASETVCTAVPVSVLVNVVHRTPLFHTATQVVHSHVRVAIPVLTRMAPQIGTDNGHELLTTA